MPDRLRESVKLEIISKVLITPYQSPEDIKPGLHLEYIGPDYLAPEYIPNGEVLVTDKGRNWYLFLALENGIVKAIL